MAILGSDSSHTEVYARLIASDRFRSEVTVSAIWGEDAEATGAKARDLGIQAVAPTPEGAMEGADGVLILARFAEDRTALARLALKAAIPVFIDKCISEDPEEAEDVIRVARSAGVPLMSCSPYRFAETVARARELVDSGEYVFGTMVGPRECNDLGPDPRFARLGFYGVHSAESVVEVFGADIEILESRASPGGTFALAATPAGRSCAVALLSDLPGEIYRLSLAGKGGVHDAAFGYDADAIYPASLRAILDQLFNGEERVSAASNLASIRLVAAMDAAA